MQERWQMNKLGFVNFWLYDQEEFLFSEGRLLLRGENGAGKSVTTQSFIPFMLDGDLRPYRLDSFGSKDRKMSYYLLGDQKEESTGYLYLEFIKPQQHIYRTLVVGLRAKRNSSNVDFWGFCLSDGRRIGVDFALYETKGSQHISLTRQEAHNRFGDGENWVERGSDYKQMVNRMLFGCAEEEQYDRLLRLLVQLRKPKLSKDFSPHLVREILNASLQPLSEDDIAPLVNSMEKMDEIEVHLDNLRQSLHAARQLRNEYTRYNQYMLGKKGEYYLTARKSVQDRKSEAQQKEAEATLAQAALENAQESYRAAAQCAGELSRQLDELKVGTNLEEKVQRCHKLQEQARQQQEEIEREQEQEHKKQSKLNAKEAEQQRADRRRIEMQDALHCEFDEFTALNEELRYPAHPDTLSKLDFNRQKPDIARYAVQLRKAAALLHKRREAMDLLDQYQKAQDAAAEDLRHARSQQEAAERFVGTERDTLSEKFAALEDSALAFCLQNSEVKALFEQIAAYEGMAQEQVIQEILNRAWQRLSLPIQQEISDCRQRLESQQKELNALAERRRNLEAQAEVPPERSAAKQATRAYLKEQGIPHASFYELVNFKPDLSPERRAMLEAQLADAGVLDALVVPADAMASMQDVLAEHPDHFLCMKDFSPVTTPLPLLPEQNLPEWADITGILHCLSEKQEGNAWFTADGCYRQGILQGRSVPLQPASYIGASARRANRERQLEALAQEIKEKKAEMDAVQALLRQAKSAEEQLRREFEQHPTTADLAAALQMAAEQRTETERKERLYNDCQLQVRHKQEKLDDLRAALLPLTKDLPYEQNAESYDAMVDLCEEYWREYYDLDRGKDELARQQSRVAELEQQAYDINDELLACTDRIRRQQAEQRKTQAAIEALEQYLNQPEIQALTQKLERLKQELEKAQKEQHMSDTAIQLRQNDLAHLRPELAAIKRYLQEAIAQEEHKRQIFEEEIRRGPGQPGLQDVPLWRQAEIACDHIRQNDRKLGPDQLRTSLEKNLRDAGVLNEYRITLNTLFESEEGELRSRVCIDLYPEGQRMDLLDFIHRMESRIETDEQLLSQADRNLVETILNQTITTKLSHRINRSEDWTRRMSKIMESLDTSMGLRFSLVWKGRPADQPEELDTHDLLELLRKDPAVMGDADREKITAHFRAKIAIAREKFHEDETPATYSELMRQALDFRNWFTFRLYYQKGGTAPGSAENPGKKELTDSAFNSFSGGEKAMAMYVPLFAALSAQYAAAGEDAPRIMALDEAFAGVDEKNIESMFGLAHQLGLNYIMNSQSLWGCYASVPSLNIAELFRPQNSEVVTVLRYHWDGHILQTEEL